MIEIYKKSYFGKDRCVGCCHTLEDLFQFVYENDLKILDTAQPIEQDLTICSERHN